jgi:hypothetical protein
MTNEEENIIEDRISRLEENQKKMAIDIHDLADCLLELTNKCSDNFHAIKNNFKRKE